MEEINAIIQKEINKQVQNKLTTFIEHVSVTYDISMKVLIRDLMKTLETPESEKTNTPLGVQCMGVCSNRRRCKFSAGPNGYCKKHTDQWRPPPPPPPIVSTNPVVKHTHSGIRLFDPNCPACKLQKDNRPKDKLLINI
jgi:hypothetical protein